MTKPAGALGVTAVSHVSINVSDMDATLAFFEDVLGFEVLFDHTLEGEALEKTVGVPGARARAVGGQIGDFCIEMLEASYADYEPVVQGFGLNVMTFEVSDIDAAYAAARERGIECESGPIVWEEHKTSIFFMVGPDRQRFELAQYLPGSNAFGGAKRR